MRAPPRQVLALRTFATSGVYFWDDRCRKELGDWRKLFRKIWGRLYRGTAATRSGAGKVRFKKQEDVMLIPGRSEHYDNPAFDAGEAAPGPDQGQGYLDVAAAGRRDYSPATRADMLSTDDAVQYDYASEATRRGPGDDTVTYDYAA